MVAILAALSMGLAACGEEESTTTDTGGESGGGDQLEMSSVKVGKFLTAGIAGVPIADSEGMFEERGLTVEQLDVPLPNLVPSVMSGDTQFGIASAGGILQAAEQGIPIKIVAPAYYANPAEQGVYVGKDSPIKSIEDLKGKKIATGTLQSVAHAGMLKAIQDAGMDPQKDVEVITFDFPNIPAALRNGKLQAGHMSEPLITVNADSVREVIDDIYPYGELPAVSYWFTSESFATENPNTVKAFREAVSEAQDLAAEDEAVTREAVGTITQLEPAVLEKVSLPGFGSDPKKDQLAQEAEVMKQFGFIKEVPDIDTLFVEGA